ncbi:MAG: polysaccharide biosynthesis tyrosine autokinase, partial [Pirellulaceae bacterium]
IKKHEAELNELTPKTVEPSPRKFLATYLASLREMVKLNDAAIADLNKLFQQERDAANHLSAAQLRDNSFRSEIERKRKLYDTIVKRLDEINMAKEATTMRLERVFQPQPGAQVSPDFALSLGLGGILGALVGLGLAYAVDRADRRFRSPDEIRTDLGLPVVGQIPVIPQEQERPAAEGDVAVPSVVLRTHFHPRGRISEAYRAVRTALYFSTRGSGHQIIQITSPSPGDGKTTLACNLAVTIAQSGKRVLLVDADFRRPRVHRVFNATNDIGVTSVLDGQTDVANVTQTTCVENLWLLPCGVRPENPSELLTSGKFEELLGLLREQYDFVIVDTPPVLAVTDPLNVVTRADGVILVMRLTKSARAASHRALETLEELGANMLGVVVNGVGGTSGYGDYGKYGGYGSYGGYGYGGYGSYGYGYGGYDYRYGYGEGDKSYYEDADDVKSNGHARLGSSRPNGQP